MTEPSHEQKELSAVWAYMGDVGLTARFLERLLSLTRSGRMRIGEVALGPLTFKPGDSASDRHKSWD